MQVVGQISLDFGGALAPEAIRFRADIRYNTQGGKYLVVQDFTTLKSVSGGGADILLGVLKSALQEALDLKGESLLVLDGWAD